MIELLPGLYLLIINILAFLLMGFDKSRARGGRRRISERALFTTGLVGGVFGIVLGMTTFRHKTRKRSFIVTVVVIIVVQVLVLFFLITQGHLDVGAVAPWF